MKLLVAALLVAAASAACPNACSGHGRCTNYQAQFSSGMEQLNKLPDQNNDGQLSGDEKLGYDTNSYKKDSCTCFTEIGHDGSLVYAWTGADCSMKTCRYNNAHGAETQEHTLRLGIQTSGNSNFMHDGVYMYKSKEQCSGRGNCDYKTGLCECFAPYTGDACQRTTCPNDCSGRGVCLTLHQFVVDVVDNDASYYVDFSALSYAGPDAHASRGCLCDAGFNGPDCSLVECPSSADPMGGEGSESGRVCSGRGSCSSSDGSCACYEGYFGTTCDTQRANVF